jgi:hypothetical protein
MRTSDLRENTFLTPEQDKEKRKDLQVIKKAAQYNNTNPVLKKKDSRFLYPVLESREQRLVV